MSEPKHGSGVTTNKIQQDIVKLSVDRYIAELKAFGPRAPSKKSLGDMEAGFRDGMRTMFSHLVEMGVIHVMDDDG